MTRSERDRVRLPWRYLPWLIRDRCLGNGIGLLVMGVLVAWISWLTLRDASAPASVEDAQQALAALVRQVGWIFVLLASGEIVSRDRKHGYYRDLFSRPVSPEGYYLLRWLSGLLVAVAVPAVLALALVPGFRVLTLPLDLLIQMALLYLLLGGLVLLASTVIERDWLVAVLAFAVQGALHGMRTGGVRLHPVLLGLETVLPPFHLLSPGQALPQGTALLHLLGYAAGLVVLALAVVRYRPLGSGSRL